MSRRGTNSSSGYAPLIWSICRRHRLGRAGAAGTGHSVWMQPAGQLASLHNPAALPGWLAATTQGNAAGSCAQHGTSRPPMVRSRWL
jgi:hypothetical protein